MSIRIREKGREVGGHREGYSNEHLGQENFHHQPAGHRLGHRGEACEERGGAQVAWRSVSRPNRQGS